MVFRWGGTTSLTARKAPQLATVALAEGAADALPALAALRELVRLRRGPHPIAFQNERRPEQPHALGPVGCDGVAREALSYFARMPQETTRLAYVDR
jgi:hypothetical protein